MEESKQDRRTRKTRAAIQSAFVKLMTHKDISKITIREIAEIADINRATFYLHYADVYQVLEEIEEEVTTSFFEIIDQYNIKDLIKDPYPLISTLSKTVDARPNFSKFLMQATSNSSFLNNIKIQLKSRLCEVYGANKASELYFVINFYAAAAVETYQQWFNSGKQMPLEQLCKHVSELILHGISKGAITN